MKTTNPRVQSHFNRPSGKPWGKRTALVSAVTLACFLLLFLSENSPGQEYSVLHYFTGADGAQPFGGLVLSGTTLYGTTMGTVFKVNTDGSDFTTFSLSNGANSVARLAIGGTNIYGTTTDGGSFNKGTVFRMNTDGTGHRVLNDSFDGAQFPFGGVMLSGNVLYGTTQQGGNGGGYYGSWGTVFALNTDGTGFHTLHTFGGSDGLDSYSPLLLSGDFLYGTTWGGGAGFRGPVEMGYGTVFKVRTDGSGFQSIHYFYNFDGHPFSGLTLSGSTLYGTTMSTVFKVDTDGSNAAVLKYELASCHATLTLGGNALYGTTEGGGDSGYGTVFKINTNGSGYTILKSFAGADGASPRGQLVLSGTTLYGTAPYGGISNCGVVFRLSLAPVLVPSGPSPGRLPALHFHGFPGVSYVIESAPELTGPWGVQTNLTAPPNGAVEFEDPSQPLPQRKFYRVRY